MSQPLYKCPRYWDECYYEEILDSLESMLDELQDIVFRLIPNGKGGWEAPEDSLTPRHQKIIAAIDAGENIRMIELDEL